MKEENKTNLLFAFLPRFWNKLHQWAQGSKVEILAKGVWKQWCRSRFQRVKEMQITQLFVTLGVCAPGQEIAQHKMVKRTNRLCFYLCKLQYILSQYSAYHNIFKMAIILYRDLSITIISYRGSSGDSHPECVTTLLQ